MKKATGKSSLLSQWKNRTQKADVFNPIEKAPFGINIPLTHGQKRLWFLQQLYPKNPFYNLSEYYIFNGSLNIKALKISLEGIIKKHEILKSYYETDKNDKPVLKINNSITLNLEEQDFSNLPENEANLKAKYYMDKQANFSFNLATPPLIKSSILKINAHKHFLILTFHHIIIDQWSLSLLKKELAYFYNQTINGIDLKLKNNEINFIDYAHWQNNNQTYDIKVSYWKNKLAGTIPLLNLPNDFKRPIKPSYKGKSHYYKFSKKTSSQLLDLSKRLEITPFILFLTAYYLLLHNFSKQEDILIGTPVSNRNQHNLEQALGLFIDTLVLRISVQNSFTILEFIKNVRSMFMDALSNKDVPFDVLVKELNIERSLTSNPFFQAMFVYTSKPELPVFGSDLKLIENSEYTTNVSKFDITLFVTENKGILSSLFEYSTDLFEEKTIQRYHKYLCDTLEFIINNINKTIDTIPVLTIDDKKLVEQNNATQYNAFESYQSIHSIIENIAIKHPSNLALTFEESSINYNDLNKKANRVAQELLKNSKKNNAIVGLCIERSIDMIIGLLGILKAGYAYLPIDPKYPSKRVAFMLKDAEIDTILTQTSLINLFDDFIISPILIDTIYYSEDSIEIELPIVKNSDLAFIIYTSGSTGQPKGVPITHKNIISSTSGRLDFYSKNPTAFLLMSSISFDSSKAGIFWTLCTGGNLIITKKRIEQDIEQIANTIEQYNVSHTLILPSLYKIILDNIETTKLKSLTTVIVAGENCSKLLCDTHFKTMSNAELYNEYGPTEASVWCIAHKVETVDLVHEQIPIGKPVANAQIYLLDENKKEVPFGVSGEIYVGGDGLTEGYLNRSDLTTKVFINNPFNTNDKLYRTGDIGKYRTDGNIEFLGRVDQQIKIRGFRVELDEISNVLNKSNSVEDAVVLVNQDNGKPKQLIAYIKPSNSFDEQQIRKQLQAVLPDYMIPNSFVLIEKIPLLPNGKIDKKSLSIIDSISIPKTIVNTIEKPKNTMEQTLLNIWKDVLNIESLGTSDNFFEIGGDSILSIQITAKARKLGISIAPNQLFEHQTISELAMFVSLKTESSSTDANLVTGNIPLTPIQKWFFDTHRNAPEFWNQIFTIRDLPKIIHKNLIKEITDSITERHDALRSKFYLEENKWNATLLRPDEIDAFNLVDISDVSPSNYDSKIESTLKHIQDDISLETGSLFKCIYFETGDITNNSIVLLAHHLVIDFVSWQIILENYTDAIYRGEIVKNDSKTASIKTWGNHLLELSKSDIITNELDYWKTQLSPKNDFLQNLSTHLPILEKDISSVTLEVDKDTTKNLINNANNAYNTRVDELILCALIDTLGNWTKNKKISLALERHGRETNNTDLDMSNTVGWFTSFFPKTFDYESASDIASKIIATKEQMRNIPNGGLGYGILRYLNPSLEFAKYPEIIFNFLGKQNTEEHNIEFAHSNTRHPLSETHHLLEINALIKNEVLTLNWSYGNQIIDTVTISSLIDNFNTSFKDIITHCVSTKTVKYTPSDFSDVDLDQDDLDSLLGNLDF